MTSEIVDSSALPRSVIEYMTILPSRRELASPAVRSARIMVGDEVFRAPRDPCQIADAQLVGRRQRRGEYDARRVGQRLGVAGPVLSDCE